MKIEYTVIEGGAWLPLDAPCTEADLEDLCRTKYFWSEVDLDNKRTVLDFEGHRDDMVQVHSIKFPDGRIWDSTLRNFRHLYGK